MNSSILHKDERWFGRFFFLFVLLAVTSIIMYFIDNKSLAYTLVSTVAKLLLLLSILSNFRIINKTKKWRQDGREITEKIGLKKIILLETNLISRSGTKVYEIHHSPEPFKVGFALKKQKRSDIINQLKHDLEKDFEKLYNWKMNSEESVLLITTTHASMAHIWGQTGKDYFYMKKMDEMLDPYVKMNKFQWLSASFSTTGRINFNPPQEWDSYYFYSTSLEKELGGQYSEK